MNNQKTVSSTPHQSKFDEQILVVKRTLLLGEKNWHGLNTENLEHYLALIKKHKEFLPRGAMEHDPSYKQIIPYLVFEHNHRYFLMQRSDTASEKRLQSKLSLGIGGHMREKDMEGSTIFEWANREFHEEISYTGSCTIEPIGILNDDSNDVGKVHIGLVLLLRGDSSDITIKSELKSGQLVTLQKCKQQYEQLENWSKIVFDYLNQTCCHPNG